MCWGTKKGPPRPGPKLDTFPTQSSVNTLSFTEMGEIIQLLLHIRIHRLRGQTLGRVCAFQREKS